MQTEENILNLYDASLAELEDVVQSWGQPSYRARQIYRQLYVNLTDEPQMMTDLSLPLRDRLTSDTQIGNLKTVRVQKADAGLTRKALFRLPGGAVVESVLMVYPDRATVCVSTQAGCAMGCDFCATGKLGLLRNLSPGEIIEQVLWAAREVKHLVPEAPDSHPNLPQKLSNVVFMGMGEPFANYDRWWQSVERLHDPRGFNLGARNLTVSTVGLVPGILRLAEEKLPINLAISLHTADDTLRSEMMPVNRRYPIAALMEATQTYITKTNRRVSFEYVLLEGRNDSPEQATDLANLVEGMLCHINLIPWNPVPGMPLSRSNRQRISTFQRILQDRGVACTVRVERGVEIAAACGQLAGVPIETA